MFARVNAVFGSRENALVIPEEAIVPQGGRAFVVKVVPGEKPDTLISERVVVKVGLRQPGKVEILDGLAAGDTVVTAGHQRLQKDGTPVRVVDLSQPGGPPSVAAAAPAPAAAAAAGSSPAAGARLSGAPATASQPNPQAVKKTMALAGPNPCLRGSDAAR
jgi:membrane fusion protein (multidrug efflux system)